MRDYKRKGEGLTVTTKTNKLRRLNKHINFRRYGKLVNSRDRKAYQSLQLLEKS